jgi:solute carrier family 25 folate transporter 32
MFHAAYTIVQEEGVLALYKGSVPALMLVSHGGIQFVTYEFLKGHFTTLMSNGKERRENELQRRQLTIGERLQDSLGYLVMGAMSKL